MAKYDYFISYSSKDKDIAFRIVNAIESAGYTCWIAPRNIPYGTPYARAIMEGIDECDTFIVLITDNSIESEDVLNEVDNAHAIKKAIIPVKLTETMLPRELNYYLSRTHWMTLDPHEPEKILESLNLKKKSEPFFQESQLNDNAVSGTFDVKTNLEEPTTNEGAFGLEESKTDHIPSDNNDKSSRSQYYEKLKSAGVGNILGVIFIIGTFIWMMIAIKLGSNHDTLFIISFIGSLSLLILMTISLISPKSLKLKQRKQGLLYYGISALFMAISSCCYVSPPDSEEVKDLSDDSDSILIADSIKINTEELVDLGLSVLWSSKNVGAAEISKRGVFLGWGGLDYAQTDTIYQHYPQKEPPSNISGDVRYDAATKMTVDGKQLRIPTKTEAEELVDKCTWQRFIYDGQVGCAVTGPNGNTIFIPSSGWSENGKYTEHNPSMGNVTSNYWTGTLTKDNKYRAYSFHFNDNRGPHIGNGKRYYGFNIRPVADK